MSFMRVVMLAVVCAALSFGQEKGETAKPKPGGKSEGIKVHGHWVLEVRNADGTLASRREFENALLAGGNVGSGMLATVLSGGASVGGWLVQLTFGTFTVSMTQTGVNCATLSDLLCNNSLTAVLDGSGTQLILQGTSPAVGSGGSINIVDTLLIACNPGILPAACLALPEGDPSQRRAFFSSRTLAQSLAVQPGQTITAIVTLSFS